VETASPQSATTVNDIAIVKGFLTAQVTSATRCIGSRSFRVPPLAVVMIGGLVSSTLFTLLALPAFLALRRAD